MTFLLTQGSNIAYLVQWKKYALLVKATYISICIHFVPVRSLLKDLHPF